MYLSTNSASSEVSPITAVSPFREKVLSRMRKKRVRSQPRMLADSPLKFSVNELLEISTIRELTLTRFPLKRVTSVNSPTKSELKAE